MRRTSILVITTGFSLEGSASRVFSGFNRRHNFIPLRNLMATFDLKEHGITVSQLHHNLPPSALYEHAMRYDKDASIAENGALVAYSGAKTGRSPKDKRIVKNPASENSVWWGDVNVPIDARTFDVVRERAKDYLNICEPLYCFDGFAGWDPKYRIKV